MHPVRSQSLLSFVSQTMIFSPIFFSPKPPSDTTLPYLATTPHDLTTLSRSINLWWWPLSDDVFCRMIWWRFFYARCFMSFPFYFLFCSEVWKGKRAVWRYGRVERVWEMQRLNIFSTINGNGMWKPSWRRTCESFLWESYFEGSQMDF